MKIYYHKKSLGQNFLLDKEKIKNIVAALELMDGDTVMEIGPGHGEVTKEIKHQNSKVKIIAIEKDERLAKTLREDTEISGNDIEVIPGDALKILPSLIKKLPFDVGNLKLVGNIPYYITGFLLRILSGLSRKPKIIVLTVQKEVAKRICAQPPKMNLLAASVQFWAKPEIVDFIPKEYFHPRPKVDSAVTKLTPKIISREPKIAENYYKFIKILFRQPRKTILNNLLPKKGDAAALAEKLRELKVNPSSRPQDLSAEDIARLSEHGL